jgi:Protein of unknown function (DUF1761)
MIVAIRLAPLRALLGLVTALIWEHLFAGYKIWSDYMANANLIAILIAALSGFLVGGLWYGPIFGKIWRKEAGITNQHIRAFNPVKIFGLTFAFSVVSAIFLGHLLASTGVTKPHIVMMISVGVALGFIIPALGINYLFNNRSGKLFVIDAGYWIAFYAAMGGVFVILGS